MTQLPAMMQVSTIPAKVRLPMIVAVLAAFLFMVALAVAASLGLSAAQEMSGSRMVYAGGASLTAALSLMVAIHAARS